jgi:hypothetical protein
MEWSRIKFPAVKRKKWNTFLYHIDLTTLFVIRFMWFLVCAFSLAIWTVETMLLLTRKSFSFFLSSTRPQGYPLALYVILFVKLFVGPTSLSIWILLHECVFRNFTISLFHDEHEVQNRIWCYFYWNIEHWCSVLEPTNFDYLKSSTWTLTPTSWFSKNKNLTFIATMISLDPLAHYLQSSTHVL